MDDKRTAEFEARTSDRPDVSRTVSQTGHDTDGRSPDYDVSPKNGSDIVSDGITRTEGK